MSLQMLFFWKYTDLHDAIRPIKGVSVCVIWLVIAADTEHIAAAAWSSCLAGPPYWTLNLLLSEIAMKSSDKYM